MIMYAMLALWLVVISCTNRNNNSTAAAAHSLPEHCHRVDSLVSSISNDTLSLLKWLPLAQVTDDLYTRMAIYYQLGIYHQNNHAFHRAIEYHTLSLETAKTIGDVPRIIKALNALGSDYKLLGIYNESSRYYFKALALHDLCQREDTLVQVEKANTFHGLGLLYLALNQTDEALNSFMRSREHAKHPAGVDSITASPMDTRLVHEQRMEYDSAYNYYNNQDPILSLRLNYEKETNEAEKNKIREQFQQKEKKAQYALLGNLIIIVALLVFIFVLIQNYRINKSKSLALLQMEKLKTAFCARISEEFKTPISIIIGMMERIKDDLASGEKKNHVALEILSRQTESLYTWADEVASIANLQGTRKSLHTRNGNVIAYLQYLYECFAGLAESKRLTYTFHSNVSELFTNYEPDYLRAILNNLLDNAMKQCTENDQVAVRVKQNRINKNYSLEVAHTGHSATEDGITIGLALAKHLAEKIGGRIQTTKNTDEETVFSAIFPLPTSVSMETETPHITIRRVPIGTRLSIEHESYDCSPSLEKPMALIVQENKYLSYYLTIVLQDKFQVVVETNGDSALNLANERRPDLIVSDTRISSGNGFELCKKIKDSTLLGHVPVILLTSTRACEERVKGFASGADACLEKPLYEDEFMAVIDQLLSSRRRIRDTYTRMMGMNSVHDPDNTGNEDNIDFLQRVTNLIYKEITNTDNIIEKLSSGICLSSSQLNRRIKAITGMTTSNYILKTRLNRAKKHLITSAKPIGEIAMQCGFNDFAYFSRSFKKEFGMTPTAFQRLPVSTG